MSQKIIYVCVRCRSPKDLGAGHSLSFKIDRCMDAVRASQIDSQELAKWLKSKK